MWQTSPEDGWFSAARPYDISVTLTGGPVPRFIPLNLATATRDPRPVKLYRTSNRLYPGRGREWRGYNRIIALGPPPMPLAPQHTRSTDCWIPRSDCCSAIDPLSFSRGIFALCLPRAPTQRACSSRWRHCHHPHVSGRARAGQHNTPQIRSRNPARCHARAAPLLPVPAGARDQGRGFAAELPRSAR
jgi:hypothetical protein